MNICGITAEYNPLHNGHLHHISESCRLSGCDAVAVAMSGDFVQRGEPAILDKWVRTKFALTGGADLVAEIPTLFCLGNASQYASAAVSILEALGAERIAFGSECGDAVLLCRTAGFLDHHRAEISEAITFLVKEGLSYPAARAEAFRKISSGSLSSPEDLTGQYKENASKYAAEYAAELSVLSEPNDILALEYIMSMKSAVPLPVKRIGAGYHDEFGKAREDSAAFMSASGIREAIEESLLRGDTEPECLDKYMPPYVISAIRDNSPVFSDDWIRMLRYAIMSKDASELEDCPSGGEGLGNLLKSAVSEYDTADGIIKAVKSRRYTYTRISRLCMQAMLGITRIRYPMDKPLYIRVLGFSEKGQVILADLKKKGCPLPVITNINKEACRLNEDALRMLSLDVHAADIYNLISGSSVRGGSDHVKRPVII